MYSTQCSECHQEFSRRDVMLRHKRFKHKEIIEAYPQSSEAYPPPPPPPPPQGSMYLTPPPPPPLPQQQMQGAPLPQSPQEESITNMVYLHPFTMMISGPTACGKTTLVKTLLQNNRDTIQPRIQRIVWLYKRWQPLYSVVQTSVVPKVEFIQGIPNDLDDDDFFDPRINNLLILDDLYSEAGKDKRITDLFTEGSHHLSLYVISINQNLFGNKDPTQRRNCHYLVLFNNPVDRQAVMTLARQMYPGNTEKFQKAFAKATKSPYGYLLVDLKPFTSEKDRLKYDKDWPQNNKSTTILTNQVQDRPEDSIKDQNPGSTSHSSVGVQTVYIDENLEQEITMAERAQACDDCGLLFDSTHDVQRHVKRGWCPENGEPPAKKAKKGESNDVIEEDVEDNEGYQHLWHLAQSCGKDRFNKLYDQYIDNGENEDDATEMAEERSHLYNEKNFFERYQSLLERYWFPLMTNTTHRGIVEEINDLRRKGVRLTSAVKRVLTKNKTVFEDLFEIEESDSESEEDANEEDSE